MPPRIQRFTFMILMAYTGLATAALIWIALRNDGTWPFSPWSLGPMEPGWTAAIGVGSGFLVALASQLSVRRFSWARRLEVEFAKLLGHLSFAEVILIAIFSSIGEELFFRGAMQPQLGLVVTSLVFGLLHTGPGRVFLPWTMMATAMGFALGGLFSWTGSLLAPILCHGVINGINLRRIALKAARLETTNRTT